MHFRLTIIPYLSLYPLLAEIACSSSDFEVLCEGLHATGLDDTLNNKGMTFTVFAYLQINDPDALLELYGERDEQHCRMICWIPCESFVTIWNM